MEYTSVLAGVRFSDHPRCTAPTLASLARLVNDASSDTARPELSRYAPELAVRPQLSAQQSATVVAEVLSTVADALEEPDDPWSPRRRRIRRLRRLAGRESRRAAAGHRAWVRAGEAIHRGGAARLRLETAIRSLGVLDVAARDRVLTDVLATALGRDPAADLPPRDPAGAPAPATTGAA